MKYAKKKITKDPNFLKRIRSLRCMACGAEPPSEAHHIKSRGAGGGDDPWNVLPLCPNHHTLSNQSWHVLGKESFLNLYPWIRSYIDTVRRESECIAGDGDSQTAEEG